MTSDLLNTEISDAETLKTLPLGAVVMNDCAPYQRIIDGDWYCAGSDVGVGAELLLRRGPVMVLWLPPEVTGPMNEPTTIDAAIEQVVRGSGDRDALLAAVRSLADAMGYQLTVKPLPRLSVGDRVRLLRDLPEIKAGALGEVVDLVGRATVDVLFDGQPYPMLYGREDVELVVEHDAEAASR